MRRTTRSPDEKGRERPASTLAASTLPAATILLLRDGEAGLEVFMVVRHHQIDFASGALVFPGGKADPDDFAPGLSARLQGASGDDAMRAIEVSGIREAFEECGVLLARSGLASATTVSAPLISAASLEPLAAERQRLNDGSLRLADFLEARDLSLACDQLVHFAHWVTPEMMPKRFDTHFYVARAPEDQLALHDGYESVDSVWIRPQDAIDDAAANRRIVIFPTLRNLEKLAQYHSVEQALERSASAPVVTVLPWTEQRDDGTYLCIPTDAGYAHCEEKMPERPG